MILEIPKSEFNERQKRFLDRLNERDCNTGIIFSPTDIFYLTRFFFMSNERPVCFFLDEKMNTHLFVSKLEQEHAEKYAIVDYVHSYPEYPGLKHPMLYLKEILKNYGFENGAIGYDSLGYSSPMGYRGPIISELINASEMHSIYGMIQELRFIKSGNEISLIKESCKWGHLAHMLLQKYTKAGLSEIEISQKAAMEATKIMIETLGENFKPHGQAITVYYRGQIGQESAFPHAVTQNIIVKKGDNLITLGKSSVFGYGSELERTMFVEEYSKKQEKYFNHMCEAQEVAFSSIKPGVECSTVEKEVQRYFKDNELLHLTRHHSGHNLGLQGHEAPFFDIGDKTIIIPGMVFSVEPGIYVKGLGGFRHSDTVLVTEDGIEKLTDYPRNIESLICK